jgi:hypothetical protein
MKPSVVVTEREQGQKLAVAVTEVDDLETKTQDCKLEIK